MPTVAVKVNISCPWTFSMLNRYTHFSFVETRISFSWLFSVYNSDVELIDASIESIPKMIQRRTDHGCVYRFWKSVTKFYKKGEIQWRKKRVAYLWCYQKSAFHLCDVLNLKIAVPRKTKYMTYRRRVFHLWSSIVRFSLRIRASIEIETIASFPRSRLFLFARILVHCNLRSTGAKENEKSTLKA